jgi:predicted MPP superfamily phosphohydrolase
MNPESQIHKQIISILEDGKVHHKDEFKEICSYDGLRGRISEMNRWGYVIRRTNDIGQQKWAGNYFKCITIPLKESKNEIISVSLKPDSNGKVSIIGLGDIHYGNPCFTEASEKKLDGYIDWVLNTDGAYTILMGDLIESANERATFKIKLTSQEQYEWVLDKFKPLSKAGKIIGIISGNHENWIFSDKGFDIVKTLSLTLGVPYLGDSGYIGVKVGKQFYTIYATHPRTGVTKKSTKIKMLEDLGTIHNVDIVMCGHHHAIITEEQISRSPNFITAEVDNKKQLLVGTGAFLEYGDYAEQSRYRPEVMGAPKIKLYSKRFDMHMGK